MQKSKINVLLVALSSALALTACNSGTSSSPTPTPTPTPTPSPSPTPTPTPTPTPVPGESGVYALSGTALSATYSTSPSTNTWTNFASGSVTDFVGGVASESAALLINTGTNATSLFDTSTMTINYGIYYTTGAQIINKGTVLPVAVTNNSGVVPSDPNTVTLPAIAAKQIASNGSNAVTIAPVTAHITGDGANPVVASADTYALYTISATGTPTALSGYYDLNGAYTSLSSVPANSGVYFINGMYYVYNLLGNNTLLQSRDGVTWQQITNNTVLNTNATYLASIVQVSGSVYAALDEDGGLYLGSSAANLTYIQPTSSLGYIASASNGTLFVVSDRSDTSAANLNAYTPTSTQLGSAVAVSSAFTAIPYSLVFAGGKIYSVKPTGADTLYPLTVTGNVISQQTTPASTVASSGIINGTLTALGGFIAMGSNVLAINSDTSLNASGALAAISAVASNGTATYNNLPTGSGALASGFAGTTNGYMMVVNNGDVLVSSSNGFAQASTILNPANGNGAVLSQLASANSTYLASDVDVPSNPTTGNLYYSADNGTTWATITPTDFGNGASALSINTSANGLYFINVTSGTAAGIYQTATPQTLSTWVKVNSLPISITYNYWDGQYYQLTNTSANVGVYDNKTAQTVIYNNVLPQDAVNVGGAYNVAYNGSSYGLAQVNSSYLWTSADLIGGVSGWTQNTTAFTGVNGVALSSETFLGPLTWTGKVWVATGATGNLYTAPAPSSFTVGTYTSTTGVTTAVNSGSASGLF